MVPAISPPTPVLLDRATAPSATPILVNGTYLVPALNGTFINPDYCTAQICSLAYAELTYRPSFAGNLAYLVIFALFLVAQVVLGAFYRTWGFAVGLFCGLLLEIVGYVGRILLHSDDFEFNYFVIYLVCLTIAPAFLSASIYLCLSRIIVAWGSNIARFSPKVYTITFVSCDIVSLALQAAGGGLAATSQSGDQMGVNIMIAGLAFQVASLALFMALSVDFMFAVRKASAHTLDHRFAWLRGKGTFRFFPYALALATITIFIRCCFRVAELKNGFGGSLANNQTLFMVFEGPMIMVAVLCLTVLHPGIAFGGAEGWKSANWTWKRVASSGVSSKSEDVFVEENVKRENV